MPEGSTTLISRHRTLLALGVLILISISLRILDFPSIYQQRDVDERAYVQGGLMLFEGISPPHSFAPAGPQTWIVWTYAGVESAKSFFHSPAGTPMQLRPFEAVDQALFDLYHDWSGPRRVVIFANIAMSMIGVLAAFGVGLRRGGLPGAILVGGLAGVLPLFVDHSDQARPYAMAWGLAFAAMYLADRPGKLRVVSAVLFGLAVASRIDMLLLLPVMWAEVWLEPGSAGNRIGRIARYTAYATITSLLAAPWLLTDLLENLRAIATIRMAAPSDRDSTILGTVKEFFWDQGLDLMLALVVAAIIFPQTNGTKRRWGLAVYVLLLLASAFKATGYGLRHQGAPLIAAICFSAYGASALREKWRPMLVVIVALVLPFVMSVWDVGYRRKLDSNPHVAEWIDQHIPAGTIVYMSQGIRDPLPTAESSAALWSEVANPDAWQQKFSSGLSRFKVSLSPDDYPRALSDANMRDERAFRREWFILGGHQDLAEPRYDVRLYSGQPVFGERDVSAAFAKKGGVLILDDSFGRAKQPAPGTPAVQWVDSKGDGVRVYCSADVKVSP